MCDFLNFLFELNNEFSITKIRADDKQIDFLLLDFYYRIKIKRIILNIAFLTKKRLNLCD